MKLSVVLLAVLVAAVCTGNVEGGMASKEELEKCLKEQGLTKEDFHAEKKKDEPSQKFKCTLACIYAAFINEDGTLNMEKISEKLGGKQEVLDAVKECSAGVTKGDKCQTAFVVMNCLKKKGFGRGKGGN